MLFAYAAIVYIQSRLTRAEFRHFFFLAIVSAAGAVFLGVIGLTYAGERDVGVISHFGYLSLWKLAISINLVDDFHNMVQL